MRRGVFTKSVSFLIIALLASAAVFQNQWLIIGVFIGWLLFNIGWVCFKNRSSMVRWFKKHVAQPQTPRMETRVQSKMIDIPDVLDPPALVALRHLNCRISDKLRSAFPDVTWSWETEQPEPLASKGGAGRIKLHQAGEFTHAEVTVDQLARINFKMMKLVDIDALLIAEQLPNGTPAVEAIVTTDAAAWFDLVGREQLIAIVTELNTRNHHKLSISVNGDVYVVEDDVSVKQDTLENLPKKVHWGELIQLFTDIGIKEAQVVGEQLRLAW